MAKKIVNVPHAETDMDFSSFGFHLHLVRDGGLVTLTLRQTGPLDPEGFGLLEEDIPHGWQPHPTNFLNVPCWTSSGLAGMFLWRGGKLYFDSRITDRDYVTASTSYFTDQEWPGTEEQ